MMRRWSTAVALWSVLAGGTATAAGPLLVNGAGRPLAWTRRPIPYNPDRGTLGSLDNNTALSFVAARFATWAGVSTASTSFSNAGLLPVDVVVSNATAYLGVCGDGLNPIIFDTDGSIIRALFGIGQENVILGAAGPDCWTEVPPSLNEASAILNGRFINGIQTQLDPEVSLTDFSAVFTHEFGHYIGLDHSQINLAEAFDGNAANDNAIATMFPILINGTQQSSLKLDDQVSISMLYPSATFASAFGSIRGSVFRADGQTLFQGAYVIARDLANPRINAVGIASGFLYFPGSAGGPPNPALAGSFELDGLTGGHDYSVEIEAVDPIFKQGSSVGPLDPPAAVPVPEFWNGANEAATNPPDNPASSTPVHVTAGAPISGINFVMNTASGALPANDQCTQATVINAFPYTAADDTTGASESAGDPVQTCSTAGAPTSNSVWYRLTADMDGVLTVETCGSNYDTVLSGYSGSCAALAPVACNDDVGSGDASCGATQSRISFDVVTGSTYFIEVTQYGSPAGGSLALHAALVPRNCIDGKCIPGGAPRRPRNCMAEWLVEPEPPTTTSSTVTCTDGAACDFDNTATNGSCTFHVAVCLNNHDAQLPLCTPTDVLTINLSSPNPTGMRNKAEDTANAYALLNSTAAATDGGSVKGACRNVATAGQSCMINADCNSPGRQDGRCTVFVRFAPATVATDECGISADVVVPVRVRPNGSLAVGKKSIRLITTSSTGAMDVNHLTLRCVPNQ